VDRVTLQAALASIGVPPDSYCLHGDSDEALCLDENHGRWSVYYSERGCRTDEQVFATEDAACDTFLIRIRKMLRI
jgi:hypothetical protein